MPSSYSLQFLALSLSWLQRCLLIGPMDLPQYTILLLPKKLSRLLARRFASLNVEAIRAIQDRILLYAPQFLRTTESWEEDLAQSDYSCHVLVIPNMETGTMSLEDGQWVGMCVLHGPLEAEAYNFFNLDKIQPDPVGLETRWLGGRLYLKEQHRNFEAMRLLNKAFINNIELETKDKYRQSPGKNLLARLQVSAYHGTIAHQYHLTSGARVISELTRKQDLEYDGYLREVPGEFLEDEDSTKPISTVFEYVLTITA